MQPSHIFWQSTKEKCCYISDSEKLLNMFMHIPIVRFNLFVSFKGPDYLYCYTKYSNIEFEGPSFKTLDEMYSWANTLLAQVTEFEVVLCNGLTLSTFFVGDLFVRNLSSKDFLEINSFLGKPFIDDAVYIFNSENGYTILTQPVFDIEDYVNSNCITIFHFDLDLI